VLDWHRYITPDDRRKEVVVLYNPKHPNYHIWLHDVINVTKEEFDVSMNAEYYTYLQFKISAKRKLSFHLTQNYLPTSFFNYSHLAHFFHTAEQPRGSYWSCNDDAPHNDEQIL